MLWRNEWGEEWQALLASSADKQILKEVTRIQHLSFLRKSDSDQWNKAIVAAAGNDLELYACGRVCVLMAKLDCQGILIPN